MTVDDDKKKPWDAQPDESAVAYQAFRLYLYDQASRLRGGMTRIAEACGVSPNTTAKWATVYKWAARAAAFDKTVNAVQTAHILEEASELARAHRTILQAARELATLSIQRLLAEAQRGEGDGANLSVRDTNALLQTVVALDRLIASSAADLARSEPDDAWDLDRLTDEEVETLDALRRKARPSADL